MYTKHDRRVARDRRHGRVRKVVSGTPAFAFRDPQSGEIVRLQTGPGDFVWVHVRAPREVGRCGGLADAYETDRTVAQ